MAGRWGLMAARVAASRVLAGGKAEARRLAAALNSTDAEAALQAADTARRLCEMPGGAELLRPHRAKCLAALATAVAEVADWRTRSHLVLVAAHIAAAAAEQSQAFTYAMEQSRDKSNVVRACALEAIGILAGRNREYVGRGEEVLLEALRTGTPAMRVRARDALNAMGRN